MSDLSMTAMYTSATWAWGKLPNADLLLTPEAERVFRIVNGALSLAHPFGGAPSLPHSLLARHGILDDLVRASGCKKILELAAGLSRRGITFSEDRSIRYVEVDTPDVIAEKRRILGRAALGRELLTRENFELIAGDVTQTDLDSFFPTAREPLFVIAEGLLMYLPADTQMRLFSAVAARLRKYGGVFAFDLVPTCEQPSPGVAGRILGSAMRFFTRGGDFVRDARTRDDIRGELVASGFSEVELHDARASAPSSPPIQQLVFSSVCNPETRSP